MLTTEQIKNIKIAEKIASNESNNELTNIGIRLGTMFGIGGFVANTLRESMYGVSNMFNHKVCDRCGDELLPGTAFCGNCGVRVAANSCSKCGFIFVKPSRFCPICGVKKEVAENEK